MKVSCGEGVASHTGLESCGDDREVVVEALTGERAGWVLSPEILNVWDADALMSCGRQDRASRDREGRTGPAGSKTPCTHRSISRGRRSLLRGGCALRDGSREIPCSAWTLVPARAVNPQGERRR